MLIHMAGKQTKATGYHFVAEQITALVQEAGKNLLPCSKMQIGLPDGGDGESLQPRFEQEIARQGFRTLCVLWNGEVIHLVKPGWRLGEEPDKVVLTPMYRSLRTKRPDA